MRISDWSSDVCSSDLRPYGFGRSGCFQSLHPLGQRPKRAIERHVLVNAVDRAGLAAADAALGVALAALQPTPNDILLNDVERGPEAVAPIFTAARLDDLLGAQRAFVVAVAGHPADLS